MLEEHKGSGVGEIGLDNCNTALPPMKVQEECFAAQLKIAFELHRPLSLHCVEAWEPLFRKIKLFPKRKLNFMLHSFSASIEITEILVKLGAFFSFSPASINKAEANKKKLLKHIPLDRLMFESDAPNKNSRPDSIVNTISIAADRLALPCEKLIEITYQNCLQFFGVSS